MPTNTEIGDGIGRRFHGPSAHTITARVRPTLEGITISRVITDTPNPDLTLPPKLEAAYAIHLHHTTLLHGETWIDGKHAQMPPIVVGSICIFDLETAPVARVQDPLDFTRFGISQATLMDLAYERGQSTSGRLRIPALGHADPVIQSLALALVNRAKMFGDETDSLFADWIGLAFHSHLKPDAEGFLKLTKAGVYDDFAQDLTASEKAVLYATNAPTNVKALGGTITKAAWHDKPSWYVVAANDRAIQPTLEAAMAKTIHATTTTVKSSHVAMLAKPAQVASVIGQAASH